MVVTAGMVAKPVLRPGNELHTAIMEMTSVCL